jgi:hypothetical protein
MPFYILISHNRYIYNLHLQVTLLISLVVFGCKLNIHTIQKSFVNTWNHSIWSKQGNQPWHLWQWHANLVGNSCKIKRQGMDYFVSLQNYIERTLVVNILAPTKMMKQAIGQPLLIFKNVLNIHEISIF